MSLPGLFDSLLGIGSFFVALLVSAIAAPYVFKLLLAAKSKQIISQYIQEHSHKQGTPTMGGIIVLIGLLAGMAVNWRPELLSPTVLIVGFALIGFVDDYVIPKMMPGKRGFSWIPKLLFQIAVVVAGAWLAGERSPLMIFGFAFMILFFCNAYNFSDGLDSLAGGIGMIMSLGLVALALVATWRGVGGTAATIMICSFGLFGAFFPFMFLNAPPAKVFMGDVGSLPIGAVLGFMWWILTRDMVQTSSVLYLGPMLLFAGMMFIEIVPPPLQVFWVKLTKKRLFPFKTPVHHAFQEKKWPETRIVWMFHLTTLVFVMGSIYWFLLVPGRAPGL